MFKWENFEQRYDQANVRNKRVCVGYDRRDYDKQQNHKRKGFPSSARCGLLRTLVNWRLFFRHQYVWLFAAKEHKEHKVLPVLILIVHELSLIQKRERGTNEKRITKSPNKMLLQKLTKCELPRRWWAACIQCKLST